MVQRVPWDELSSTWIKEKPKKKEDLSQTITDDIHEPKPRNYYQEADAIGRRVMFGAVCGAITGASFGFVDVMRDRTAMISKSSVATGKVLRFSAYFGGYFALYQGTRKLLKFNITQTPEENILTSTIITTIPMFISPQLRPMVPYGLFLILVDSINSINDV